MNITAIKEYLSYDEHTGHLTWIKRPSKNIFVNTRAGSLSKKGYRTIKLFGKLYLEHRVAWAIYYNEIPKLDIDHINHIRDDNRISNLRLVTKSENARNQSKFKGSLNEAGIWYCKRRQRYIAQIQGRVNGRVKSLWQKTFTDIDEAIKQRKAKCIELGFHENHGE